MQKRVILSVAGALLLAGALSACGGQSATSTDNGAQPQATLATVSNGEAGGEGGVEAALVTYADAAQGFAIGLTSHGIGTARALQVSEAAGAFSALAMGLNGLATSLLAPLLVHWLQAWLWG